jgi:hypothetical protein
MRASESHLLPGRPRMLDTDERTSAEQP